MRILHIVNFFDSTLGYSEYYLARKQLELGLDVKVLCSNHRMQRRSLFPSGLMIEDNIPVVRLNSKGVFRGNILVFNPVDLAKVVKNFSPDVIHCHNLLSPLSQVILLRKTRGYKVVGDLITGISPLVSRFLPSFKSFFNFWVSNKVDAFFACNMAVKKFLLENLGILPSKVHFIPLGADIELFKPNKEEKEKVRKALGISSEDVIAIYTGKFLPSKRIHDLLVASKPVIEQYNNFKLVLVGDGPPFYKDKMKFLIRKLGIDNNVLTLTTVHRTKLPNFYNAADFAVWPGTFSISIVEAMACGLPIIIAKSDWTSHYLEYKNGFSFRAGDLTTLTSLMFKLIQDNKLRKFMGDQSRRLVEDKLSWDVISRQYVKVYRTCQVQK